MTVVSTIQDAAKRVWEKMGQVKEKKAKLKYTFMGNIDDPRDLKTVEKDLAKSSDLKEAAYTDINKLNNEQKDLNEKISRTTNQAATAERNAREKEDAFKRDQESTKRKDELNDELKKLAEQEKEFDRQVRRHCHPISRNVYHSCTNIASHITRFKNGVNSAS
jgi:chromosome segregation ATPase